MLLSTYNEEFILSNILIFLLTTLVFACVEENNALFFPMGSDGTFYYKKFGSQNEKVANKCSQFFQNDNIN